MTPQLFERHQDYVMSIGDLAAGELLQGIPLALDPDAPFVLRSKAIRCQYDDNDDVYFDLQVVDFVGTGTFTFQCFLEGVKRGKG
jgi:hypothetical protein